MENLPDSIKVNVNNNLNPDFDHIFIFTKFSISASLKDQNALKAPNKGPGMK